jgi:hypothetical protein
MNLFEYLFPVGFTKKEAARKAPDKKAAAKKTTAKKAASKGKKA